MFWSFSRRPWPRKRLSTSVDNSTRNPAPPASQSGSSGIRIEPLEPRALLAGSGLAGAYFARTNFTLTKFARPDAGIDFGWTGGTAAKSLGTDGFSTRWVGRVEPKFSETYTFI